MDKQQLRGRLEQLHAELQETKTLDATDRELLQNLAGDIREILERGDDHPQQYSSLGERLNDAVAQLEATHPRATMLMRQVVDQLAFMGI